MKFKIGSVSKYSFINNVLAWVGATVIGSVIGWVILMHFAMKLLSVNLPLAKADWIVVLGGESGERVIGAAELYHQGIAPRVLVTGSGDCSMNTRRLQIAGVPVADITQECWSNNTNQNAVYTRRTLTEFNPQKIVLVTSWYHTGRALRTFRQVWPEVQFGAVGVVPGGSSYYWLPIHEAGVISLEYVKSVWYGIRYSPLGRSLRGG